jgi:hypothetical protein
MIGEIGGPQEAEASAWVKENMSKPVVGYVAGLTAPKGRRMGHAGAIISAFGESAQEKVEILTSPSICPDAWKRAPSPTMTSRRLAGRIDGPRLRAPRAPLARAHRL